jgi:hypothetical protein
VAAPLVGWYNQHVGGGRVSIFPVKMWNERRA